MTRRKLKFFKYMGIAQDSKVTTQGNSHTLLLEEKGPTGCYWRIMKSQKSKTWPMSAVGLCRPPVYVSLILLMWSGE